jgi:tetratricopeptide (TPR) repeat protein
MRSKLDEETLQLLFRNARVHPRKSSFEVFGWADTRVSRVYHFSPLCNLTPPRVDGIGDRRGRNCPLDPTFEREPSSFQQSPKAILVDFQRPNLRFQCRPRYPQLDRSPRGSRYAPTGIFQSSPNHVLLQGYSHFERDTAKDTDMAASYYERATQLDPSYALAWVGLSRARNWQVNVNLVPPEEGHRLAREAVERALALNPNLAEAHAQMGRIKQQVDCDWVGSDASIQRAIALEPGNPEIVLLAASSAGILGRLDEALPLNRRAIDLDALNADSWEQLAETEFFMGQLDKAAADFKKALELNPDVVAAHMALSQIYVMQGRPQDALPEIELVGHGPVRASLYPIAYYALGRKKESHAALSELIAKYHASMAYQIADAYAFRNQSDEAFEWLERAYAQRDSGLISTKGDPLLKSLHNDPRYVAFLKKLNLPT